MSPWVQALGGTVLPRADYMALLKTPSHATAPVGPWTASFTLAETAAWEPDLPSD
jgi:leucyl/phenylalanyl-tRNA--protein transferase